MVINSLQNVKLQLQDPKQDINKCFAENTKHYLCGMASIRQEKVSSLLKRDLSEILQQEGSRILSGKMVSVTVVRVTPDLGFAKVYLSVFPTKTADQDLKTLRGEVSTIRGILGRRIKNQVRIVPEIQFYWDDSLDYAARIDELLS